MTDSKQRFSNRVADYIKYRPKYPAEVIDILEKEIGLKQESIVADIGAGTGFLTELFLKNGNATYAIEPNEAMREACNEIYGSYQNLTIVSGSAEDSGLPNNSIDIIIAGQAFHWFDQVNTKKEFERILKPNGHIVLIWNARKDELPFTGGYENILSSNIPEYKALDHRNVDDAAITTFFIPKKMKKKLFPIVKTSIGRDLKAECSHLHTFQFLARFMKRS
ncbi:class I SAM-dependent methyltransferase [Niabella ginsengisoli]|uniref:Class I SAM-dependent methyltransferase n=1 Tax=Niabella ginsengisoli TaxID=522298 RepID=A0ABS9SIG3_9BACT|nr:class I SAM-dependent methyltransferase [Niabella ginsengisoli]MCH5598140.1 class I SAM-dependent methyltransferase [Niabella ginsengisoli]